MAFKGSANRNIKKLFSAAVCLGVSVMFFGAAVLHGFTVSRLLFGVMTLYFSVSFFRSSKE